MAQLGALTEASKDRLAAQQRIAERVYQRAGVRGFAMIGQPWLGLIGSGCPFGKKNVMKRGQVDPFCTQ